MKLSVGLMFYYIDRRTNRSFNSLMNLLTNIFNFGKEIRYWLFG